MNEIKPKLICVNALKDFTLELEYDDGLKGILSLSRIKDDPNNQRLLDWKFFESVQIDNSTNDIIWDDGLSLCKNASYRILKLNNIAESLGADPKTLI